MIRELFPALLAAPVVVLVTSCSSSLVPAGMWPTVDERKGALAEYGGRWEPDVEAMGFGLARSVGIVDHAETASAKTIPRGMAALVSETRKVGQGTTQC